MADPRRTLGRRAEDLVAERLEKEGWQLLARNSRSRAGEIDIIALKDGCLVFVEVKSSRIGNRRGATSPVLAVDARKQARLRRLAREWLAENPPSSPFSQIRFDVVGVSFGREGELLGYEHIEAAF